MACYRYATADINLANSMRQLIRNFPIQIFITNCLHARIYTVYQIMNCKNFVPYDDSCLAQETNCCSNTNINSLDYIEYH